MINKIKDFMKNKELGTVKKIKPIAPWANGERYIVTTNRLFRVNEFIVYTSNGEVLNATTRGGKRY